MPEAGDTIHVFEEATVVQLLQRAHELADARLEASPFPMAKREFALAKTAIEDAMMRYTRGRAIELDVFKPADLDSDEALRERKEFIERALDARERAEVRYTPPT